MRKIKNILAIVIGMTFVLGITMPITAFAFIGKGDGSATLTVVKEVINDDGGTAVASDFTIYVKDGTDNVEGSPQPGEVAPGTVYDLSPGTYAVSEDDFDEYSATFSGDCDAGGVVTIDSGENLTCTITNSDPFIGKGDDSATLNVIKTVINDDGGTAVASDFTINVDGTNVSPSSFAGSEEGVEVTLDAGSYDVTEDVLPGYLMSGSGDCSGTIEAGETKTCTITNKDIAPQLIVNKIVINDDGGTKLVSDFLLFVNGESVESGVVTKLNVGSHTVSETTDSGYEDTIGGDCEADGTITLELGDVKTCTITNDDIAPTPTSRRSRYVAPIPPLIDVVKVPNPLALPDGPDTVEYTYRLNNIGTVPVTDITMVDDSCDPITLISGDTDGDNKLDVDETWVYTCSTTLTETHTNIVSATGWANGISTTDTANATVIVGLPIVPPLINITKVPKPLLFSAGGGMAEYTYKVTNPGTVALSDVKLADDKCDPVEYVSGDTNNDSKLDPNETWTYVCQEKITKTTVNTVTASGRANNLTARDSAIAAVVVDATIPKLPDTGFPPRESNSSWIIVVSSVILGVLTFYFVRRKQTA